ncbi:MAG: hypothetical protein RJA22_887 [Verrucomicrobiota bacterium]|jgi:hypothetical protein
MTNQNPRLPLVIGYWDWSSTHPYRQENPPACGLGYPKTGDIPGATGDPVALAVRTG